MMTTTRSSLFLLLPAAFLFGACVGDVHTTKQSPPQPSRSVPPSRPGSDTLPAGRRVSYEPSRVYEITRLETAQNPRGEWRAQGQTIRVNGSTISFLAIGQNNTVTFTGPYQITPTAAHTDRTSTQLSSEMPAAPESTRASNIVR